MQFSEWSLLVDVLLTILIPEEGAVKSNPEVCAEQTRCFLIKLKIKSKRITYFFELL